VGDDAREPRPGRAVADPVLDRIRAEIGAENFERYLGRSTRIEAGGDGLRITVASRFAADLIDERFGGALRRAMDAGGSGVSIRYEVSPPATRPREEAGRPGAPAPANRRPPRPARRAPAMTLDGFVVGASNRLAFEAARRVAESPDGREGCPFFVYGPSGVGKTHLLSAIAGRYGELHQGARVRVVTAEAFTNEYIAAIRGNAIAAFHRVYRRIDLLCIDDVHFLSKKNGTQTELMHTFDTLDLGGARVVLASDAHPRQIRQFSDGLVSRFLSGSLVRIESPDPETRRRLIRHFADQCGLILDDAAVASLAEGSARGTTGEGPSARDLLGLVNRVRVLAGLTGTHGRHRGIDGALVAAALRAQSPGEDTGPGAVLRPVPIERIIERVCEELGVTRSELGGAGRHKAVVLGRALTVWLAKRLTTRSYPEIATSIGLRSHSTMLNAHQRIQAQMDRGEAVAIGRGVDGMPIATLGESLIRSLRSSG
jgi:chromosomal replication initiator protein